MKSVLVAGGAGFIGSNLCETLVDEGHYVICMDNLYTGSKKNIEHLQSKYNFEFIHHDIIEPLSIDRPIDQIYNLACPASPSKYQKDSVYTLKINFIGVLNLLEFARQKKASLLQSSTSEVYGEPEVSPQSESYRGNVNIIGIRSCYDEGKRIAETLMMDYHKQYGVDIRIVRIFNTYGPRMDENDGRVVSNFINQALHNKDITLYGDGSQTRSFCFIDDLIKGIIKLMNSNYIYPVNIGNSYEITVKELADTIISLTKSKSIIVYKELPLDDPTNRKPDISVATKLLDWMPKYNLRDGLVRTIEYFSHY